MRCGKGIGDVERKESGKEKGKRKEKKRKR